MTIARKQLIDSAVTPYYHIIARCVRRSYLCGFDSKTGKSYNHRKDWILERLSLLVECFSIGVCSYAVMDNHYHLVLHIDQRLADQWNDKEVLSRKHKLFPLTPMEQLYMDGAQLSASSQEEVVGCISLWRERLRDLSWFMRCLNECIARKANREDDCKGRFWESRFKSQALLDLESLQACMAYVDLNPVRAGVSSSLEGASYTSIQQRIIGEGSRGIHKECKPTLVAFDNTNNNNERHSIPFALEDYVIYLQAVGSVPRTDKKSGSCFLKETKSKTNNKVKLLSGLESAYGWVIGTAENLRQLSAKMNLHWIKGVNSQGYFKEPVTLF